MIRRRGSRTRAATAALLSSLFPGMGQLYNRDWMKAATMITVAVALMIAVKIALANVLTEVGAVISIPLQLGSLDSGQMEPEFLSALADPGVQSYARRSLLPPLLGLCAVLLWSMRDAYRTGRNRAENAAAAQEGVGPWSI